MSSAPAKQANPTTTTLSERLADSAAIEAALKRGVREALRRHKRRGQPVVVVREGKPVWLAPEQITIDDEPANGKHE